MDIFIHVGGLKSHYILSFKLKVPSLGFTFMYEPSSFINASNLERKMVVEVTIVIAYVNVININVVTRRRITEDQMF
jgi:hypothetical protein